MSAVASTFRIPAALDGGGRLVVPDDARRGARYSCPSCFAAVDLHAGEKKRRHFHHRAGACSGESVTHLVAKRFIAAAIDDWLAGGPPVALDRGCAHEGCAARTRQAIPRKVSAVSLEHVLPSGHVADVALLARGVALPVCVIEVRVTHAVDDAKAREIGVPWVELDGARVCADRGRVLVALRDRLVPWLCADHRHERGRAAKGEREERRRMTALSRSLPFRVSDFPGYRAERAARCPRGHTSLVFTWEGTEPPWPRPPCVVAMHADHDVVWSGAERRTTKVLPWKRRYASVCTTCGSSFDEETNANCT
jgi:hypothetical protein